MDHGEPPNNASGSDPPQRNGAIPANARRRAERAGADAESARESARQASSGTVFSPHPIAFKLARQDSAYRKLDLTATLNVAARWREALISHSNHETNRVRGLLSGHDPDGKPLKDPHLAFLPLAFAGFEHADGHLLGMALALPADVTRDEHRAVLRVVEQARELKLGPLGVWHVDPVIESSPPVNLRPETWTAGPEGATQWSTVTPVAFDRHPKAKNKADRQREQAAIIAKACERIGLPKPRDVIVTPVSAHLGVPPAHAFPKLERKDGSDRRHTHAILLFDEPVCGPVSIGAGRFRGYGVCRAMDFDEKGAE